MSKLKFDLAAHTLLLTVAGSRAYGMALPTSDVDLKGVAQPPLATVLTSDFQHADHPDQMAAFLGVLKPAEQRIAEKTKLEGSVYALRKFVRLAVECNPHILDVLFCRDEEVRLCSPIGEELREFAPKFLSLRARHSFGGYARSQLKRIQTHRKWLLHPPASAPSRADFGLPERPVMPKDELEACRAAVEKQLARWTIDVTHLDKATAQGIHDAMTETLVERDLAENAYQQAANWVGLSPLMTETLRKERLYRAEKTHFRQFLHWQKHRNPERAALEAHHGFDTKHASHLVRLMRMAIEIMTTNRVRVWRGDQDADELLAIRQGAWSFEELMAFTVRTEQTLQEVASQSSLPTQPDRDAIQAALEQWTLKLAKQDAMIQL